MIPSATCTLFGVEGFVEFLTMCLLFGNVDTARLNDEGAERAMVLQHCNESIALLDDENIVRVAMLTSIVRREVAVWLS